MMKTNTPNNPDLPTPLDREPLDDTSWDYPNFDDDQADTSAPGPDADPEPPADPGTLYIAQPRPHKVTVRDDKGFEIAPPECPAVRPDGRPYGLQAARDTYNLPTVQLEPLPPAAELDISTQISPDINTPEYKERPARVRAAYRQHKIDMPHLPPMRTLDDYINLALFIMRCYRAHTELYQLVTDCHNFCHPGHKETVDRYFRPYERAGNYVQSDVSDHDPAPIDLYIQRARKKTALGINRMLTRTVHEFKELDSERVRNILALAAATKYVRQSDPTAKRRPGRPFEDGSRLIKKLVGKGGHGGARPGGGRPRKKKQDPENENKTAPDKP
jgi:hypothetical protein